MLPDGSVAIADHGNHTLRLLSADLGSVTTLAGKPGSPGWLDGPLGHSLLNPPAGMDTLPCGRLIFCDGANARVRIVTGAARQGGGAEAAMAGGEGGDDDDDGGGGGDGDDDGDYVGGTVAR